MVKQEFVTINNKPENQSFVFCKNQSGWFISQCRHYSSLKAKRFMFQRSQHKVLGSVMPMFYVLDPRIQPDLKTTAARWGFPLICHFLCFFFLFYFLFWFFGHTIFGYKDKCTKDNWLHVRVRKQSHQTCDGETLPVKDKNHKNVGWIVGWNSGWMRAVWRQE